MKYLTEEKIKSFSNISNEEIKQDIKDTEDEVQQYREELKPLMNNPSENRLQIYLREGKIAQREVFIAKLQEILVYRIEKEEDVSN